LATTLNRPDVIYPDLSYSIVGAAMSVHNGLGPGWDEWDYHRAMIETLRAKGHVVVSHDRKDLIHRGSAVDLFELDLMVDGLIVLELKHIKSAFHPENYTQIINYLKRWGKRLGILINFGLERLASKRIPYDPIRGGVYGSGKWEELLRQDAVLCELILTAVNGVLDVHGYGYGVQAFQNLLIEEFRFLGSLSSKPTLTPQYRNLRMENREIDCIVLDSGMFVSVSASGCGSSSADLAYLKSYMKQSGIPCGVLIDIGSSDIQVKGVM